MGGDDSQKLLPWRGIPLLSGAQQTSGSDYRISLIAEWKQTLSRQLRAGRGVAFSCAFDQLSGLCAELTKQ